MTDLVKRLREGGMRVYDLDICYDIVRMIDAETDQDFDGMASEQQWVTASDAAAALEAKDAEIAALKAEIAGLKDGFAVYRQAQMKIFDIALQAKE